MAKQTINIGITAGDGTGDTLRNAFDKCNDNFDELYTLGASTNLTYTPSATNGTVNSDTGTDATIPLGNGTNAGLSLNDYTTIEKSKLSGIATGATSNSSDTTLLDRANHTGTQTASTISDFNTQVATTAILKSNNLSDLTNTTTARTNLGLGSLATQSGTFSGTSSGTNTGDNAVNTTYANDYRASNFVAGTDYLAPSGNGSALTGLTGSQISGNISGNASNVTGTVAVVNGGTGATTNTGILIGNGTSAVTSVAGTAGQFLRRNAGDTGYEFASLAGGGDAVIANGLQQFTGTTSANLGVITKPTEPIQGNIKTYGKLQFAEDSFTFENFQGQEYYMQDAIFLGRKKGWFFNGTTTVNLFGQAAALSATGTLTAAAVATTSDFTKITGSEYLVTTAATTAVAGFRESANSFWLGNTANDGGFSFSCTFGTATGIATTTHRLFVGMSTSTVAPTDVNPSTLLNMFGVGYDSADANMQIMRNDGTGTATKIDLGGNFVVPTVDRSNFYRLDLYAAPNSTTIYYKVSNLTTGDITSGNFNTDIPAVNTLMSARGWISVGGTSSVIGMKVSRLKVDSIK